MSDGTLPLPGWERVVAVLARALERPPGERPALLDETCGDDPVLRAEVERLLAASGSQGEPAAVERSPAPGFVAAIADRYRVAEAIGAGGMAVVYRATDVRHGREVALKVLRPEIAARVGAHRFLSEIRVTATLQHPHVLPLHDSGEAGGFLFYVVPYVSGGSLRDLLRRRGRLSLVETLAIAAPMARALDHAHRQGVVHCDVKPENILLQEGEPVVADFGIARVAAPAVPESGSEVRLGTPFYMSPEQIAGASEADRRTDVYALGCVLFECLSGVPPFPGATPAEVLFAHATAPVPELRRTRPDVPERVDRALARALAKAPRDRWSSTTELVGALTERPPSWSAGDPGGDPAWPPPPAAMSVPAPTAPVPPQVVRFCTAADGVRIAWAAIGDGPPLVKAANWLSHLEHDLVSPMWRHWWDALSRRHRLVRYDERGCGLSDRDVGDLSVEGWAADLEAVVDAAGLERFPLLGISQGGPIAITYAVRHPERVSRLVLHGSFARGRYRERERALQATLVDLVRVGWGRANPAFRQVFSRLFFPAASPERLEWFDELMQVSASPENAARLLAAFDDIDVVEMLPRVTVPTLVVHSRGDELVPFENGARIAARIPGARLVTLESRNHIPLADEPAWSVFVEAVEAFLATPDRS